MLSGTTTSRQDLESFLAELETYPARRSLGEARESEAGKKKVLTALVSPAKQDVDADSQVAAHAKDAWNADGMSVIEPPSKSGATAKPRGLQEGPKNEVREQERLKLASDDELLEEALEVTNVLLGLEDSVLKFQSPSRGTRSAAEVAHHRSAGGTLRSKKDDRVANIKVQAPETVSETLRRRRVRGEDERAFATPPSPMNGGEEVFKKGDQPFEETRLSEKASCHHGGERKDRASEGFSVGGDDIASMLIGAPRHEGAILQPRMALR